MVYDMTTTVSVSSHPLVWWYHTLCMYDITPTIYITLCILYKASHPHFMTSHLIVYDITCTVFMTSLPLYLTLHTLYMCHQGQCINYTTPTLCMTSHTVHVWHYILYAWHPMNTLSHHTRIGMTSHPVYLWHHIHYNCYHPYCFHENTTTIPVISPTIFDITATTSVWSYPFYRCYHNNYVSHHTGTHMTSYTLYITSHSHFMTSILSIYDITNTAFMTSDLLYMTSHPQFMTSHPLYLWYHSHYICNITPTMFLNTYQLYLKSNTRC